MLSQFTHVVYAWYKSRLIWVDTLSRVHNVALLVERLNYGHLYMYSEEPVYCIACVLLLDTIALTRSCSKSNDVMFYVKVFQI